MTSLASRQREAATPPTSADYAALRLRENRSFLSAYNAAQADWRSRDEAYKLACVNADPLCEELWKAADNAACRIVEIPRTPEDLVAAMRQIHADLKALAQAVAPLRPRYGEDTTEEHV